MVENKFEFSVIMAVYNCENYLDEAVNSLLNQDVDFRKNVQLILVDDGSTDNSKEICLKYREEYEDNIKVLFQKHAGVAAARNLGLSHAQGKYINFMDADDCLSQDALRKVSNFFEDNFADIDVVAIPVQSFERENKLILNYAADEIIDLQDRPKNQIFPISATFIKSDAISDEFKRDLICSEDVLFLYKILLDKSKIGVLSSPRYYFRKRYNLSAVSDTASFKKEFYTDRLNKFHLDLIGYCNSVDGDVPRFIQYMLLEDLNVIVNQDDLFMCDDEIEMENLHSALRETVLHIDDETISGLDMGDSLRYFYYTLKHDNLKIDFENYDPVLRDDDKTLDDVYSPQIIITAMDFEDKSLIIKGFFNDYLKDESYTIEALSKENGKIKRSFSNFINYPSYKEFNYPSIYQKFQYFNLKVPVCEDTSKIKFKVLRHINGDKNNYMDDNLLVFNPIVKFDDDLTSFKRDVYEFSVESDEIHIKRIFDFNFAVVMAIYNTEDYLHQSIDSVINQTLDFEDNVQLILVDDGSEDSSGDILKEYHEKYPNNISIITQENAGQAHARNNGFELVKSKYMNFLDSDDYLEENALEEAYKFFEIHYDKTDVVSMPIMFFEKSSGNHMLNNKYSKSRVIDLVNEPNNPQLHSNSAFFKSGVFRKYKFATNVVSSEDVIVINKILMEKMTLGVINTSHYFYRKRFDESSTLDSVSDKKEFYIDKLRDYYLHLFDYALSNKGFIPSFLKFTLAYDLQWVLKEDLSLLNNQEQKEFWFYLNEVIKYIDEEMILENKYIRNKYTMQFFLSLKRNDLHAEFTDDNVLLKIGDYICGDLSIHKIWWDIVDLREGYLNLSGFLYSFFNIDNISIEAVKYLDTVAFERYRAEYVKYTKREHMSFLSVPFQYKNTFDIKIPIEPDEKSKIKIFVNYHKDGDNTNFRKDNIVSVNLGFSYTNHVKLSELSNYKANDFNLLHMGYDTFYLEPSSSKMIKKFEKENIETLKQKSSTLYGSKLEMYNEIIHLREKYLSDISKSNLFSSNKEIYLFEDRIDVADDNAYHLFKYASTVNDNVDKYFVLSKDAKQYEELSRVGRVVEYGSLDHKLLVLKADKIITTHPYDTVINPFLEEDRDLRQLICGLLNYKIYWLQHGVTKDNISDWMSKFDKNLDLIVTVSDEESKSFLEEGYGYDESIIQNLGFPRFDNLTTSDNKQILIIPTWRKNITWNKNVFVNSDYFRNLSSFLNSSELIDFKNRGYDVVFRPHPELMKYVEYTETVVDEETGEEIDEVKEIRFIDLFDIPNEIRVSTEESYQELFNTSSVLVTDYSSVFFDFAYLKKPVVYFHPNDDYHYEGSYFDYESMGFGDVLETQSDVFDKLGEYIDNGCQMEEKYQKRVDDFFTYTDRENCKRVYDWILKN